MGSLYLIHIARLWNMACSDLLLVGVFVYKRVPIVCRYGGMMNINVVWKPNHAHFRITLQRK